MERSIIARRQQDKASVESTFRRLSLREMEQLILACVADSQGRTLTEPQRAARQACLLALQEECLRSGHRSTAGVEDIPELRSIMVATYLRRFSPQALSLVVSGLHAEQESRPISPCEAAALQTFRFEWKRLWEMVAVGSTFLE